MQLYLDFTHTLYANQSAVKPASITIRRKGQTIVSTAGLEARESWTPSTLDATKERFECLVETTKNVLTAAKVGDADQTLSSHRFELARLIVVGDRLPANPISPNSLVESAVVQITGFTKLVDEGLSLCLVGVYPVFERLAQLLSFLVLNVFLDSRSRHRTNTACEITSAPQGREAAAKKRKLFAKDAAGVALQPINNLCNSVSWIMLKKDVYVIWHHFHCVKRETALHRLFGQECFEAYIHTVDENGTPVFGTPNKMHLQAENCPGILCVTVHSPEYTPARYLLARKACDSSAA